MPYRELEKQREQKRRWKKENRAKFNRSNNRRRKNLREKIALLKIERGCYDCGITGLHPDCYDWDHIKDKNFGIAYSIGAKNFSSVVDEISKCQLVCSNCHRIRTLKRRAQKDSEKV